MSERDVLKQLTEVLEQRKAGNPDDSYVASLHARGLDKILEKVGEESTEVILAAKNSASGSRRELIAEMADLWFHSLVLLSHLELSADDVLAELERRFGLSGLEEKASRSNPAD